MTTLECHVCEGLNQPPVGRSGPGDHKRLLLRFAWKLFWSLFQGVSPIPTFNHHDTRRPVFTTPTSVALYNTVRVARHTLVHIGNTWFPAIYHTAVDCSAIYFADRQTCDLGVTRLFSVRST